MAAIEAPVKYNEGGAGHSPPCIRRSGRLWESPAGVVALFLLVGLLIYLPALGGGPIWDDEYLVGQNPFFRSPIFIGEVFRHFLFLDNPARYYRPVQNISYMVDYWFWAGAPLGYHLTNVVLHSLSGALLFGLLRRLLPGLVPEPALASRIPYVALGVAMLWTVHPIHNAAVAYVSGRADSLASLFALSAWLLVLRMQRARHAMARTALGAGAATAIMAALCSKELAVMWIALFLIHLFACDRHWTVRSKWIFLLVCAALVALYAGLRSLPAAMPAVAATSTIPASGRLVLMLRALGDYTGLIFFPGRLTMDRMLTNSAMYASGAAWQRFIRLEYLSIVGFLALGTCLWFCLRRSPGQRLRIFGAAWFAAAFLPISNLVPLNAQVAEHWIYLASIGYLLFLGGCVVGLNRIPLRNLAVLIGLAVPALGIRTAYRASDWADAETFYWRTINSGGGTARICTVLANVYAKRGDYKEQERVLRRMIELFPEYTLARINLGTCLVKQGRAEEAKAFLDLGEKLADVNTRQTTPSSWLAPLQLAGVRAQEGDVEGALAIIRDAQKIFPGTWDLIRHEAKLHRSAGRAVDAAACVERFVAEHWWHEEARLFLAELRVHMGALDAATEALHFAASLDVHDARPFALLARVEIGRERFAAACHAQQAAIRRAPDEPVQYLVLAAILQKLGRDEEARAAQAKAQLLSEIAGRPLS